MKELLLLVLILISVRTFGQLKINAGKDTAICITALGIDTIEIGGDPTASGGIEPYSYTWSTNYSVGSHFFGSSYFLDDSTNSNPKIVNYALDSLRLKVMVSDNLGAKAEDSITIRFSIFYYLAIDCIHFINQGDTVPLSGNIGKGIGSLSYFWSPNYHISDSSAAGPLAWPDTNVIYRVYAVDSIGCVSEPSTCSIYVNGAGMSQMNNHLIKSMVFPNPINSNSTIILNEDNTDALTLQIINNNGQTVLLDKLSSNTYKIGNKRLGNGYYLYLIKNGIRIISIGKFIKN